jgi:2-dehydropantoate 2-reductase
MEIKKVSIIGLGALGILTGQQMLRRMPREDLRIVAGETRIARYLRDGIFCNNERCDFQYVKPEDDCEPADLLIFAVKFNGLAEAVEAVKKHVGPGTVILSLLNGISSEAVIGEAYGMDKVMYCVAQGMDAVKVKNHLTYHTPGQICFGEQTPGVTSQRMKDIAAFFDKMRIPCEMKTDMKKHLWGKFMVNVGVNQTAAVYRCNYEGLLKEGATRDIMILAMREVMALSVKEEVELTEKDLDYWLTVIAPLHPDGKPSMQQDAEAKRRSEVELFAGTVLSLGKKHGIPTPVNQLLYNKITAMEENY